MSAPRRRSIHFVFSALLSLALAGCETDARRAEALADQGLSHARAGSFAKARESFVEALAIDPENAKARYNLGMTYLALEQWTVAAETFAAFLQQRPDDADARFEYARSLAFAGDAGSALQELQQAVKQGFGDYDRLVADAAFGALYADPRFIGLEVTVAQRAGVKADRGALATMGARAVGGSIALPRVPLPGAPTCGG